MNADLDTLYQDRPNGIDLSESKGEKSNMNFLKGVGIVSLAVVGIGALLLVAGFYHQATANTFEQSPDSKEADKKKESEQTLMLDTDELRDLSRIKKYCFGWPWEKDAPTCKVWLRHYRQLGTYSDSELFAEEVKQNAESTFGTAPAPVGNAQSPAN